MNVGKQRTAVQNKAQLLARARQATTIAEVSVTSNFTLQTKVDGKWVNIESHELPFTYVVVADKQATSSRLNGRGDLREPAEHESITETNIVTAFWNHAGNAVCAGIAFRKHTHQPIRILTKNPLRPIYHETGRQLYRRG